MNTSPGGQGEGAQGEGMLIEDDYERLPECIKFTITRKDWLWLSHEQKANLVKDETEPEVWGD